MKDMSEAQLRKMIEDAMGTNVKNAIADTIKVMHSTVDMTARNEINAIRQAQQSHERICEQDKIASKEHRIQIRDKLDGITSRMNAIIISTLVSMVVGLIAIIGALTYHVFIPS